MTTDAKQVKGMSRSAMARVKAEPPQADTAIEAEYSAVLDAQRKQRDFMAESLADARAGVMPNIATLERARFERDELRAEVGRLKGALQECLTETPGAACYNTGKKTRRLEAINSTVIAALQS